MWVFRRFRLRAHDLLSFLHRQCFSNGLAFLSLHPRPHRTIRRSFGLCKNHQIEHLLVVSVAHSVFRNNSSACQAVVNISTLMLVRFDHTRITYGEIRFCVPALLSYKPTSVNYIELAHFEIFSSFSYT